MTDERAARRGRSTRGTLIGGLFGLSIVLFSMWVIYLITALESSKTDLARYAATRQYVQRVHITADQLARAEPGEAGPTLAFQGALSALLDMTDPDLPGRARVAAYHKHPLAPGTAAARQAQLEPLKAGLARMSLALQQESRAARGRLLEGQDRLLWVVLGALCLATSTLILGWQLQRRHTRMAHLQHQLQLALDSEYMAREIMEEAFEAEAEARQRAEAADHAKSRFLANVSHELRTPLNGIIGLSRLMMDTALSAGQQTDLRSIQASAKGLMVLINDILDLSKIEAGAMEIKAQPLALATFMEHTLHPLRQQARSQGLELAWRIEPGVPPGVELDGDRVRQVILNLVGNALKFTERGRITVTISALPGDPMRLRWVVADTGVGIQAGDLREIFKPFRQADASDTRRHGGTGLGLAIARELATLMGGDLRAESEPGVGSTFTFDVSTRAVPPPVEITSSVDMMPPLDVPLRILVAEDHPVNRKVLQRLLERAGHTVELAHDGVEAVERVQAARPDLVLMDIQMPRMDGIEATRHIRALTADKTPLPIIAVTASAMKEDADRCLAAGMDAYVSKPIRPGELFNAIHSLMSLNALER